MHISELAGRHVEIPEQVVTVDDEIFVRVIDIDLERRRISLSLKQANEGITTETEFDEVRAQYGVVDHYDESGNFVPPEGFDVETGEWLEGFDTQREAWEKQYSEAHAVYESHLKQIAGRGRRRRRGRGAEQLLLRHRGAGRSRGPRPVRWSTTSSSPRCGSGSPAADRRGASRR